MGLLMSYVLPRPGSLSASSPMLKVMQVVLGTHLRGCVVKLSRWSSLLLLLQLSCAFVLSQDLTPPQKMHVCAGPTCQDLTWAGDHYDAVQSGQTQLSARYWVRRWSVDGIEMEAKTSYAVDGTFPLEGIVTGKIGPTGNRIDNAIFDWKIGYSQAGKSVFVFTWNKAAGGIAVADVNSSQQGHRSKTHPNILLPVGASEKYASYTSDIRAILMSTHPLSSEDAKKTCAERGTVFDPDTALEIAKYAYRADDVARGNCWLLTAATHSSIRARTLMAIGWFTGWQGAIDAAKGFGSLNMVGEQDPWAMYFIEECTRAGVGTTKDEPKADQISNWFRLAGGRQEPFDKIDSDDLEVKRQAERQAVIDNPPMMQNPYCTPKMDRGKPVGCPQVVDKARLQRMLEGIDEKYKEIK